MRIGIMGGTFDPIHIGHLLLGEFAYEQFHLDEVWFLPNGNPPHKEVTDGKDAYLPSNNGKTLNRFFHPVRFLLPCGMKRIPTI